MTTSKLSIKITASNNDKIVAALAAVNGKATAHAYTHMGEIVALAEKCEADLLKLITKKSAPGARVVSTSGGPVPNAYKYSRTATYVEIERRSSAWYLVAVASTEIYKQGGRTRLILTAEQDAEAVARLRTQYDVVTTAAQ